MTDEAIIARLGVPAGLRLAGHEMLVFAKLSDGRTHTRAALLAAMYPRPWEMPLDPDGVLKVTLCSLRAKLTPHRITVTRYVRAGVRMFPTPQPMEIAA